MASTTFSGPVTSLNGFIGELNATSAKIAVRGLSVLPTASAANAGTVYFVSGTSSGNTLVFSNGSANIDLVTGVAVIA